MSRLKIILLLSFGVLIVVALFVIQYMSTLRQVSFTVPNPVGGKLYNTTDGKKEQLPQTLNTAVVVSLQKGNYCVEPTDTKYDLTPICFVVENKAVSVLIDPNYSKDNLTELLTSEELLTINTIIQDKYSAVIDKFVLKDGSLFGRGEWYGATLTERVARSDQGDVYRVLLNKKDGVWVIVAYPQIILSKFDYPDVPYSVLDGINRLVGTQGSL
jgi:hypothetical protein